MSRVGREPLAYATEQVDAAAEAIARVSAIMIAVSAICGVADAFSAWFRMGMIQRELWLRLGTLPAMTIVTMADPAVRAAGALLLVIAGVCLLAGRVARGTVLLGSTILILARVLAATALLANLTRFGSATAFALYPQLVSVIGSTAILIMLPAANLVWFTRPAIRQHHRAIDANPLAV